MLEPPDLAGERIIAAVQAGYGLSVTDLRFLPLGQEVGAWAYQAAAPGATYFLKLRRGAPNETGLRVPRFLADRGLGCVVPPLATETGELWCEIDGFSLSAFPFIDGASGLARGMDERYWLAFGAALREIHDIPVAPEPRLARESFTSPWVERLRAVQARLDTPVTADPIAHALAAFWTGHQVQIQTLVARLEAFGLRLHERPPSFVLCHADIHPNNILIDNRDRLWLVDWDDALLAPKEADLMMVIGGLGNYPAGPHEQAWFLRGYGDAKINLMALAYYRHLRAVSDIAAYGEQIVLMSGASATTRRNALERFTSLFAGGRIVALAHEAALAGA